ncbi:2-hydroxychromene-2-carboxylate isomerase [Amycolatopsis samaneae]|uniref:2-hydroxychromene-2-carboxylate isomerase n=1 Tax=Amycolatopsis samaneae TaxID=664691 RepID=A0ABW5GP44_9PSEU
MKGPRIYFSLRSPYSWLAYRDLIGRYPALARALEWRPFWEPDETSLRALTGAGGRFHYTPMSKAKNLYILRDVRRLTAERGLDLTWPVDRKPHWEVPHLAYLAAAEAGRGPGFVALAYRRRWEQGADLCARATIADIAGELGLDPAPLTSAVDDPRLRAKGVAALLDLDRDGVFGVPFFCCGTEKFWGLDRLDGFATMVRTKRDITVAEDFTTASLPGWESHAGGCG